VLLARYAAAGGAAPVALESDFSLPPHGQMRRVVVQGEYRPSQGLLLDNQSHQRRPGVHAWTPFQLVDGSLILVDRGWLPLADSPAAPPSGPQQLLGNWRALPRPGLRLGGESADCAAVGERLTYPTVEALRCRLGEGLREGLLELDPTAPGGYVRAWLPAAADAVPPQRHYGYAAQWWAFAATLLALFIKLNLRRVPADS
jgi:cytochrome oxidase assembly protein ShyY1